MPNCPDAAGVVVADRARAIHLRRQLAAAVDHGTALLAALGLPRLVDVDFVPLDPLAIGDALDAAVAALDEIDGDVDLEDEGEAEPSFGWGARPSQLFLMNGCIQGDQELDTSDHEPSLASPERHPAVPFWEAGWAYVDRGPESSQLRWAEGAQHDRELDPCDGPQDEDELDDDGLSRAEGEHFDDESTLGAPAGDGDQRRWAQGPSHSNDPEADDVDREDDELGDDRDPEPLAWVFGPSRREAAHA